MSGGKPFQKLYMFIGGIFSFFYMMVGSLFIDGKISFGFEPTQAKLIGGCVMLYGMFRFYIFYRRYKQMREEE